MDDLLQQLIGVHRLDDDTFTAAASLSGWSRVFGGHIAAQAVSAACQTVAADRPIHSLHCYFLRAGKLDVPTLYTVQRSRDGRFFSSRHVTATQDGDAIFELLASFHRPEPGPDWQPDTSPPAELPGPNDLLIRSRLSHLAGILDLRPANPQAQVPDLHPYWFRVCCPVGDDPASHSALLTYVSDIAFMAQAHAPGPRPEIAVAASIDHALWFHRAPRVDQWLFFSAEPVAHTGTRGLVRGSFHDQSGTLIASVTQEALLRPARLDSAASP